MDSTWARVPAGVNLRAAPSLAPSGANLIRRAGEAPTRESAPAARSVDDAFEHVEAVLVATERRHQVDAVREVARLGQQLARELHADFLALVARFVQAPADPLRHLDAR